MTKILDEKVIAEQIELIAGLCMYNANRSANSLGLRAYKEADRWKSIVEKLVSLAQGVREVDMVSGLRHDTRVGELLEYNNEQVELRRKVETENAELKKSIDLLRRHKNDSIT